MLPSSCICCAYISDTCGVIVLLTVTVAMNLYFSAVWKNVCAYLCANVYIFQYRLMFVLLASVVILCMTYFSAWPIRCCTVRYVLKYNVCHNPWSGFTTPGRKMHTIEYRPPILEILCSKIMFCCTAANQTLDNRNFDMVMLLLQSFVDDDS